MNPRCNCAGLESVHHHAFGGTYPCEGFGTCIQCQPLEQQQANGRDVETPERIQAPKTRKDHRGLETR